MGVSKSAVSRVTGVDVHYKNFNAGKAQSLPQRLAVIGLGNTGVAYSLDKYEAEGSAEAVGEKYGFGSPLHLAARQLFPSFGDGPSFPVTFYPLEEAAGAVAAAGSVGVTGTATAGGQGTVYIAGIAAGFSVAKDDTAATVMAAIIASINAVLEMPVSAGSVDNNAVPLTAKFKGAVGNLISIHVDCNVAGLTFAVTDMADGAGDPDVAAALNKIGTVWETVILSCFGYDDSSRLDKFQEFGENRWSTLVKMPCLVAHGCTDNYATRTAVTDARKTDYINFLITSVGSWELPFVVAAKGLISDIMTVANEHPARGYKGQLRGLHCGDDSVQEPYSVRNNSVLKGASTNIKNGSVAELNDIITFYHPTSEGNFPSRRYVVDMIKLMNIVYNVRLIMESDRMRGATLVEDDTVTTDSETIQPKDVRTALMNLADTLALGALVQESKYTKANMEVEIDSENPKRINVVYPVKLSGNVEISSSEIYFGFYTGGNA
ncbi:MAG: hypothetical protein IKT97_07710 [Spirochaetia bacterium]|nr:hypothetical protein [Spirochaetia bacterium]